MRLLITGAGGMLGHDLDVAARAAGHDVLALTRADLDICDAAAVRATIGDARPDVVVNCAAWTNVDGAEDSRQLARDVNVVAVGHVGAAALSAGAWTIHISSDYVFDGAKRTPYLESDVTAPLSDYGHSKLDGERALAALAPDAHTIVRTAWVFGAHGACFPATMMRLAADRPELTVVSDQIGAPTFTGHLATALVSLCEPANRSAGVLHVAGGGQCSWCEFAQAIVAGAGMQTPVRPIASTDFPTRAQRPAFSVLRSQRGAPELPDWREGLADYLAERAQLAAGASP